MGGELSPVAELTLACPRAVYVLPGGQNASSPLSPGGLDVAPRAAEEWPLGDGWAQSDGPVSCGADRAPWNAGSIDEDAPTAIGPTLPASSDGMSVFARTASNPLGRLA